MYLATRQLERAVQCFRLALAQKPDFAEGHNNLGSVLHEQKKFDEAAECSSGPSR